MDIKRLASWRSLVLGLALLGLAVAACRGEGDVTPSVVPAEEQVLRLRLQAEPKTIDPHLSNVINEASLIKPLFAGLFTYDEGAEIIPNLATELPTVANGGVTADGLTYTIQIRDGAKWSDGKALTASDFVYSMKRALDPALGGPFASSYYSIVGAREYNKAYGSKKSPKTPSHAELASLRDGLGVSASGDSIVVYQLTQPTPSFLNHLALWTAFPVRQDVVEQHGVNWTEAENLVGNGAFVLAEWTHDLQIVFEPNQYWHGEAAKLSQIKVQFIGDDAAAFAAYRAGELDSVIVPAANRRQVSNENSTLFEELVIQPDLRTFAVFINNQAAPFDNKLVRQALGHAIDRDAYVEGVLQGAGATTTSWIPAGMPGYDASIGNQYDFDAGKAKDLLTQAGYPAATGFPDVTFVMVNSDSNRIAGQFVQNQLKLNLGIDVDFDYVEGPVYGQVVFGERDYQATIQSWSADWPYPDNWLPELFGSESSSNIFNYSNPEFDTLMAKAAAETDDAKRLEFYGEGHKVMIDDAGLMPLYNRVSYVLVKPWVKDLVITSLDGAIKGDYHLSRTWIAAPATAVAAAD